MRIYISADMEGITGLVDADDVQPGGRDYERGRLMMAEDVNAAIRGAVAAGATMMGLVEIGHQLLGVTPHLLTVPQFGETEIVSGRRGYRFAPQSMIRAGSRSVVQAVRGTPASWPRRDRSRQKRQY